MLYPLEAVNDHRNILEPVHGVLPPYSYISATDTANPTQAPPNHTDTQASEEHLYLLLDGWREDEPLCLAISRHLEPVPTLAGTHPSPSACSSAVFTANPLQCIGSTYVGAGRNPLARKSTVGSMRGTRSVPARCSPPIICGSVSQPHLLELEQSCVRTM